MVFKGILTAAAAVSLVAAPTVAVAQSSSVPAPTAETVSADSQLFDKGSSGGFIIPLFATIAFLLGLYFIIGGGDDDDLPVSP